MVIPPLRVERNEAQFTWGRNLRIELAQRHYQVNISAGELHYWRPGVGEVTPDALEVLPQLQAIGDFYRGWLEGGEDPMLKLFQAQKVASEGDGYDNLRAQLASLSSQGLANVAERAGSITVSQLRFLAEGDHPADVDLNESDLSDLRRALRKTEPGAVKNEELVERWVETKRGPKQVTGEPVGFDGIATTDPQVLKSAAGYYIGELYQDEQGMWAPYSRNSQWYWSNRDQATLALIDRNYEPKLNV